MDQALRALGAASIRPTSVGPAGSAAAAGMTDEQWSARVAVEITAALAAPRPDELAALLAPPFPDDFADADPPARASEHRVERAAAGAKASTGPASPSPGPTSTPTNVAPALESTNVTAQAHDAVALAADHDGDFAAAWRGSMSEERLSERAPVASSRPPPPPPGTAGPASRASASHPPQTGLSGLARLARSNPPPSFPASGLYSGPGSARGSDSGLINLRGMTEQDEAVAPAQSGAGVGPLVAPQASPPGDAAGRPVTALGGAATDAATKPVLGRRVPADAAAPEAAPKKRRGAAIWMGAGAIAAAAAALFVVNARQKTESEAPPVKAAQSPQGAAPAARDEETKKSAEATPQVPAEGAIAREAPKVAVAAPAPKGAGGSTDLRPTTGNPVAREPAVLKGKTPEATATIAASAAAPPQKPASPPPPEPGKKSGEGSLDDVLGIGKETPGASKKATAPPPSDVPDRPDTADVRSAVNGRVGKATACVKGLEAPTKVTVTFGPSGAVTAVAVTAGPARGTGAESCIQGAFSAAKVPASRLGGTGYATLLP